MNFDKYAQKGNEMLNTLAKDLEMDKEDAGRILRAVLYAMRDHLSIQESLRVVDQLPMAIKGVYVSNWNISRKPERIRSVSDFLDSVRQYQGLPPENDVQDNNVALFALQAVFRMLNKYISDGEFEDIISVMPVKIKDFISSNIGRDKIM